MVQGVLEEIAFRADEDVGEEPTEVFAELDDVEDFHLLGGFLDAGEGVQHGVRRSFTAEPSRHEIGFSEQFVCPE